MGTQGSHNGNSDGAGDGSFTARGMANSKRQWLHVPTDEEIMRQFGSKNPRVVHRRTVVSELMRGGANLIQIQELVNQDIAEQNAKLAPLGMKPLHSVSMATIRKDAQYVKKAQLYRWINKHPLRVAEMFDSLEQTLYRSEQLWQRGAALVGQAKDFDERLRASEFQAKVNVQRMDGVRSLMKALGLSDRIDININHTDKNEQATQLDGAPPSVVFQRQRKQLIDGQNARTQIEGQAQATD